VLGDQHGKVIHLANANAASSAAQKLVEESLRGWTRNAEGAWHESGEGAGKVGTPTRDRRVPDDEDGSMYFIEMNTRSQSSHPVDGTL